MPATRQRALYASLTLLLSAHPGAARAQEHPTTEPSRLIELRAIYEAGKRPVLAAALERHIAKLATLQETLTRGDYTDAAATVRATIATRTRELAELAELTRTSASAITLPPRRAALRGGLELTPHYISHWNSPTASATWTQRDLPAGHYTIHLDYLPVTGGGGRIEVRNLEGRATVRIDPTRAKPGPRSTKVGSITLTQKKTVTFRVAPRSRSAAGIFLLTGLRLVPTKR